MHSKCMETSVYTCVGLSRPSGIVSVKCLPIQLSFFLEKHRLDTFGAVLSSIIM